VAKKLTLEMLAYWKKHDRAEREHRKKAEKVEEEQRKRDLELLEVKRQQRKLNFLITQTELYAHFLSRKLGADPSFIVTDEKRILEEVEDKETLPFDDYDADEAKRQLMSNVENALGMQQAHVSAFDGSLVDETLNEDRPQPTIFCGQLKTYQLKGVNWIANLYDQGISGILADEMGLGKTIQSLGFLAHVAERYDIWGPFLVVSPASTLHNWEQEISRFVPAFKVVPYWGSPNERKILRQFWTKGSLSRRDSPFHVLVTSYQLVITDCKYFQKVQWQYMILDEAQAIKSSSR
jgi:DNA helicase INO80